MVDARRLIAALILALWLSVRAFSAYFPLADFFLVEKGKRHLHLLKNGVAFRTFKIAVGLAPEGDL